MTEDQRTLLEEGCAQLESRAGLVWGPEFIEEFSAAIRALLSENALLKAERDEARRWCCGALFDTGPWRQPSMDGVWTPQRIAELHGWDCFKEVQP